MIFTPLGPDFPEDLINALLEGDVVFLCGAGVSAPQLPNSENLVRQVYASVGEERTPAEEHAFSVGRYEEALEDGLRDLDGYGGIVESVPGTEMFQVKVGRSPDAMQMIVGQRL